MANEIEEIRYQVGEAWKGEYDGNYPYGVAAVVQDPTGLSVYRSLKNGNTGHPLSDSNWWFCIIDMSSIKAASDAIGELNETVLQNENARVIAEQGRVTAENNRVTAETNRAGAESSRVTAESSRVTAESGRATAETNRGTAESGRVTAESGRVSAEQSRVLSENLRDNAESVRATAETNRASAESERHTQYTADHSTATSDHSTAVSDHNTAAADHTTATNDHAASTEATTKANNVNATIDGMVVTITDKNGVSTSVNIGFEITKTYASVSAMNADADNVDEGTFVMIATTDTTSVENARLYVRNENAASSETPFTFLCDLDQAASSAWADWFNNYKPTIESDHTRAEGDHTQASTDHNTAATDHTTAEGDHTQASTDHNTAATDHTTAQGDHTTAGTDHTTASADHTQAESDHTRAEEDHIAAADKEDKRNKITIITEESTDVQYSSAKSVWTFVTNLINTVKDWVSNTFARIDGYYKTLVSGFSEQLLSPDGTTDETPYLFRTTAGSASVSTGAAELNEVKGNSIVFNQLVQNGDFSSSISNWTTFGTQYTTLSVSNGVLTVTNNGNVPSTLALMQFITLNTTHKYLLKFSYKSDYVTKPTCLIRVANYPTFTPTSDWKTFKKVVVPTSENTDRLIIYTGWENAEVNQTINFKNIMLIDLTQMFVGTIANSMTVSQFESLFPLNYYTYNTGQIINFNGDSLKTTGFNQWDGDYSVNSGYLYSDGTVYSSATSWKVTDYIKIFPSTNYYFNNLFNQSNEYASICWYDINKNFISSVSGAANVNSNVLQSPSNARYLRASIYNPNASTACINLSWSGYRNGETEPYEDHTLPLYIKDIKDANNNYIFADGFSSALNAHDVVKTDKAIKKILTLNMGNLDWKKTYYYGGGFTVYDSRIKRSSTCKVICEKYKTLSTINESDNKFICANYSHWGGEDGVIFVKDTTYTTVSDFKTAVNGVFLNVEMQTPIEVDFETVPQVFGTKLNLTYSENDFGTEEIVIDNPVGEVPTAPFSHTTFYMDNLRDKLRNIDGNTDDGALMNGSADNLVTALCTALNLTYTKTWNATTKEWKYVFTNNQQGE